MRVRPSKGSSLLEILVTILIITIAIMGLGAMQLRTVANNQWQLQQSTAKILSYQIFERMRANRSAAISGAYDRTMPDPENCPAAISGNLLARNDLINWLANIEARLGGEGCAAVTCSVNGRCEVNIRWYDDLADTLDLPTQVTSSGAI